MVTIIKKVKGKKGAVKAKAHLPQRDNGRRSEKAKGVAHEVLATMGSGKPIVLKQILKNNGYPPSMQKNPKVVMSTKSYKEIVDPVLQSMKDARKKALDSLAKRIVKASYRDLIDATDKLTKNIQLLEGKSTENIAARVVYLPTRE